MPDTEPKQGDMRVWWIPQVGSAVKTFIVPVTSVEHAAQVLNMLAEYDAFQLVENIKGGYANAGGLSVYDGEEWNDFETEDPWDQQPNDLFPQPPLGWCSKLNDL